LLTVTATIKQLA